MYMRFKCVKLLLIAGNFIFSALISQANANDPRLDALDGRLPSLLNAGRITEAMPLAQQYLQIAGAKYGQESGEFAWGLRWIGQVYRFQDQYAKAEPYFKEAVRLREKAFGSSERGVGILYVDLGQLYLSLGRNDEAETALKRAIAVEERNPRGVGSYQGIASWNLAKLYGKQGRIALAESMFKRVIAVWEKDAGTRPR